MEERQIKAFLIHVVFKMECKVVKIAHDIKQVFARQRSMNVQLNISSKNVRLYSHLTVNIHYNYFTPCETITAKKYC